MYPIKIESECQEDESAIRDVLQRYFERGILVSVPNGLIGGGVCRKDASYINRMLQSNKRRRQGDGRYLPKPSAKTWTRTNYADAMDGEHRELLYKNGELSAEDMRNNCAIRVRSFMDDWEEAMRRVEGCTDPGRLKSMEQVMCNVGLISRHITVAAPPKQNAQMIAFYMCYVNGSASRDWRTHLTLQGSAFLAITFDEPYDTSGTSGEQLLPTRKQQRDLSEAFKTAKSEVPETTAALAPTPPPPPPAFPDSFTTTPPDIGQVPALSTFSPPLDRWADAMIKMKFPVPRNVPDAFRFYWAALKQRYISPLTTTNRVKMYIRKFVAYFGIKMELDDNETIMDVKEINRKRMQYFEYKKSLLNRAIKTGTLEQFRSCYLPENKRAVTKTAHDFELEAWIAKRIGGRM